MSRGSLRRGIRVARNLLAVGVIVSIVASAGGCAAPGSMIAGAGEVTGTIVQEEPSVRMTDFEVPGPAADPAVAASIGTPNRVGSAAVPVRLYEPAEPAWAVLVWAHGGSFVRGDLDWPESDWVAQRFAERGIRVAAVDYVLASDTVKAPAPANDVAAVVGWALAGETLGGETLPGETTPVVIGGASAGAHLAVAAVLTQADGMMGAATSRDAQNEQVRAGVAPAALLLQYPTLHRVQRESAAIAAATSSLPDARKFDADRIAAMYEMYLGDGDGDGDGVGSAGGGAPGAGGLMVPVGELPAERLSVLPPTIIVNADADDLRASGEQFAEQLIDAGIPVVSHVQPSTVHGYLNRPDESARAAADATETIDWFTTELRRIIAAG
ncbi:MAG: alpha/beta hydrolase [Leucobacter sp.]